MKTPELLGEIPLVGFHKAGALRVFWIGDTPELTGATEAIADGCRTNSTDKYLSRAKKYFAEILHLCVFACILAIR